jgi:ketosteroid isomerase-like protein
MKKFISILLIGMVAFACTPVEKEHETIDKEAIRAEVLAVMNAYKDAILLGDVYGVTRHYLDDPEFRFYSNQTFNDYEGMVKNVEKEFSEYVYEGKIYHDLKVKVLCKERAIVYSLSDFAVTDTSGVKQELTGGVTYVMVKRDDTWKIMHGMGSFKIVEE